MRQIVLFIIFICITIIIHIKSMEFIYNKGHEFYNKKKEKDNKIWDIIHSNFKDYSQYNHIKNIYLIIFLIPILLKPNMLFIQEFILKFSIIVLLRSITIISTILPRNTKKIKNCKKKKCSLYDKIIGGGFYDKMFSGHFAFGLLLTLLFFKYNILSSTFINVISFITINIIHLFILSATRSHFTMDIIVSLYVTLFIFNINYPIFF